MRWPPPDPTMSKQATDAYRRMILATRQAAFVYGVTPVQLMHAVANTLIKDQAKEEQNNDPTSHR